MTLSRSPRPRRARALARAAALAVLALPALVVSACSSSEPAAAADAGVVPPGDLDAAPPVASDAAVSTDAAASSEGDAPVAPGSGGKGGLVCSKQEALGGGRTSCVTKVGSVELKIVTAASGSGPMRLGLYLHGDGAGAHKSNSALTAMLTWADTLHGIAISALAPNTCAWWQTAAHDCAVTQPDPDVTGENVGPLAAALEAVMKAYDVRTDGFRYYGSSGGSIFLTDAWLPLQGAKYPGVFALMCGGEASPRTYAWDPGVAALRAKNPLWFTYGDADYLRPDIEKAITAFKAKSFTVTEKIVPGAGHCEFNGHGEAVGIWSANP